MAKYKNPLTGEWENLSVAFAMAGGNGVGVSVKNYGAKGNGITDDTVAFQTALAENRVVFVPSGTYVISDTLVIRENCGMEFMQDTLLEFKQTSGNCIEMRGSAVLQGNHGNINVPYGFTGNVISVDTLLDGTNHASIPPYTKADPTWKRQRFIYNVNITKKNSAGFYRTTDGKCSGTALYLSATNVEGSSNDIPFIWVSTITGLRIAGAFSYGIKAVNYDSLTGYIDDGWNHDMRIEAVTEACEVGVYLDNCNCTHLQVTVQPMVATNGTKYAKWGFYIKDSFSVDMIGSRVWDWNTDRTLVSSGNEYQHIALIGDCRGLLLDDWVYYETTANIYDTIYTDNPANFDKIVILQERFDRYFKSIDNVPYFNNKIRNQKLMLATDKFSAEQAEFIENADGYYTYEPEFNDLVTTNFTEKVYLVNNGTSAISDSYVTSDFIPIDGAANHVYRIGGEGIIFNDTYGYGRIAWYDSNKQQKGSVMSWDRIGSSQYYPTIVEDNNAFAFETNSNVVPSNGAAYFRVTARGKGANLIVTVDEPLEYKATWHGEPKRMDESIYAQNVFLKAPNGTGYKLTVGNDGTVKAEEVE